MNRSVATYTHQSTGSRYPFVVQGVYQVDVNVDQEYDHTIPVCAPDFESTRTNSRVPIRSRHGTSSYPIFAIVQAPPTATETHRSDLPSISEALQDVKRLSGLSWETLSEVFNVSRRTIHHWANDEKQPSTAHEHHIRKVLDAIVRLVESDVNRTRDRLLNIVHGVTLIDLFRAHRFDEIADKEVAKVWDGSTHALNLFSSTEQNRHTTNPPHPTALMDAEWTRPDIQLGKARLAKPLRPR